MANEYLGNAAYMTFAGTVLSSRYTSINVEESADLVDKSAGADTHKSFLAALNQGTVSVGLNLESDSTTVWAAIVIGTSGTLIYAPEGTAGGQPKYTAVVTVSARDRSTANADLDRANVTFTRDALFAEATY